MLSQLGSLLNDARARLEAIANTTTSKPDQVPKGLSQVTSLVANTNKNLVHALKAQTLPDFDQKEIRKVLADIKKLKEHKPLHPKEGSRASAKTDFLNVLKEFQANLKELSKQQKELPPVQLKGFGKTSEIFTNGLSKHLLVADEKLSHLTKNLEKPIPPEQLKNVAKILDKASVELMKAEAFKTSPGVQLPTQSQKVIQRILENCATLGKRVDIQIMAGTYRIQVSKFKESVKELRERLERLRVLNLLKKTRGKEASLIEKETR